MRSISTITLILQLVFALTLTFYVQLAYATGTIYINADGSIDPPTAPITNVGNIYYTFTADISSSLAILRGNIVVDGAGHSINGWTSAEAGIDLGVSNVTVRNVKVIDFFHGFYVRGDSNTLLNNSASSCRFEGIFVTGSFNSVIGNNASNNAALAGDGIMVYGKYNAFISNIVVNNRDGISLAGVPKGPEGNAVCFNTISDCYEYGMWLIGAKNTVICGNTISNCEQYGVYIDSWCNNNKFYNNNFINNAQQAYSGAGAYWNTTYPIGGNYWSDYTGVDQKSGPNQDQPGSDGIIDLPYQGVSPRDWYPLVQPYTFAHDIAVTAVEPSVNEVGLGELINIEVQVENRGAYFENFTLTAYAGGTIVGQQTIIKMFPSSSLPLTFIWDTKNMAFANYLIFAIATPVPGEINTANNVLTDGMVKILPAYHDVAVTDVRLPFDFAYTGDNATIQVDVWNAGNIRETINVTAYADLDPALIGDEIDAVNQTIILQSKDSTTMTLTWNTTGVAAGNYTISANATIISQDADLTNNLYVNGKLEIAPPVCMDLDITSPAIVQLNPSIFTFNQTVHALVAKLGNVTIKSVGFEGKLRVVGAVNNTVHLYIGEPGTNRKIYNITQDESLKVPIWIGLEPGTYSGIYQTTLKVCGTYKSKITMNITHIWVCGNGAYTVQGGTVSFGWTLTGGSWAYLKAETRLPPGWNFSINPPIGTLFETPQLISLNITAAPDASEEEIGIITLSAFKNGTDVMFWQFTYFATVGNLPPIIEDVETPIHTHDGKLLFSSQIKDVGAGIEGAYLDYVIDMGEVVVVPMTWQEGDTFNSTRYALSIPQPPDNSWIYYLIGSTDWLGAETFSDIYSMPINYDVAVTSCGFSKTVVGQGMQCNVSATIENRGTLTEELLNVAFYANTTLIHSEPLTSFSSGMSKNLTFTWNTTGFTRGNYTLTVYLTPVSGETNTLNNMLSESFVVVAMPGDIIGPNGWPDGKIDMRDISKIAKLFGVDYPDPRYDANCDLICDLKIDMKDISFDARRFGQQEQ